MCPGTLFVDLIEKRTHIDMPAAAIAGDDRGAPLQQIIRVQPGVAIEDRVIAVVVQVDETRRYDQPLAIDLELPLKHSLMIPLKFTLNIALNIALKIPARRDPTDLPILDPDIADLGLAAISAMDRPATQDDVIDFRFRFGRSQNGLLLGGHRNREHDK
jgi:hypothetical protein